MTNPIYPDKTKTGLAALKPLTDVFFAEPERWEWEISSEEDTDWEQAEIDVIFTLCSDGNRSHYVRLTPKPRRVWIGDQWYWEPLDMGQLTDCKAVNATVYVAHILTGEINVMSAHIVPPRYVETGHVFARYEHAGQCLDAHQRGRRFEHGG